MPIAETKDIAGNAITSCWPDKDVSDLLKFLLKFFHEICSIGVLFFFSLDRLYPLVVFELREFGFPREFLDYFIDEKIVDWGVRESVH